MKNNDSSGSVHTQTSSSSGSDNNTLSEKEITDQKLKDQAEIIAKQQTKIDELKNKPEQTPQVLIPGIPKTETFKGSFRNGWRNGDLKRLRIEHRDKQRAEMRGDTSGTYIPEDMNIKK